MSEFKIELSHHRNRRGPWPSKLPAPPREFITLIENALIDFGPDAHCDGALEIAAIALDWMKRNP